MNPLDLTSATPQAPSLLREKAHSDIGRDMKILVVEDDAVTRQYICKSLTENGIYVTDVAAGEAALKQVEQQSPDLVVLDLVLPDMDGVEVCKKIREQSENIAILMLTARDKDMDKIHGLEAGADDYMVKPFNVEELLARIRAIMRRALRTPSQDALSHRDVRMEFRTQRVFKGEKEIFLTPREFSLLGAFLQHPNRILTREELFQWIWGKGHHGSAKGLDVYVRKLREKIEVDPSSPTMIQTAWGVGYICK